MIADAVSSRSSKEDNNLLVFLESERMRAEERERIREEKERIRQDERADERRREDNRFQMQMQMMMMMMMNPPRFPGTTTVSSPPLTQESVTSSPGPVPQFDGQDFLERELLRRTSGV